MKKRKGFYLLFEVTHYLIVYILSIFLSLDFFFLINTCLLSLWPARVFEYLLLVHTTQSAGERRKSGLPRETGQSEFLGWDTRSPSIQILILWTSPSFGRATLVQNLMLSFISPQVAPAIKERMVKKGSMMIGYQPLENKVNFFRLVVLSPQVCKRDMDFCLDEIERLGNDL